MPYWSGRISRCWAAWWVSAFFLNLSGCTTLGSFSVFEPVEPKTAHLEHPSAVVRNAPAEVRLAVEQLRRGTRGGSFVLRIENASEDRDLFLDWGQIAYRLGSGQRRQPMSDQDFLKMGTEFGYAAYGWSAEAMRKKWAEVYPSPGDIYRLEPGQTLTILMHFGAGENERTLTMSLENALFWETRDGTRSPIEPPVQFVISLPSLEADESGSSWPSWLHVGFFVTNSG
ncbi:MAG: hypothetical protein NZM31_05490 [Gemmatales bacterium]|nr:hypothetical protein [Gemmatales bacterium]MDW8386451.1 hypothetical protein [Gemmatales bacterium]